MPDKRTDSNKKLARATLVGDRSLPASGAMHDLQPEVIEDAANRLTSVEDVEAMQMPERAEDEVLLEEIKVRNQKIGAVLRQARKNRNIAVSKCAERIRTSWRRYNAIEEGKAQITAVELQLLAEFLGARREIQEAWDDGGVSGYQSSDAPTQDTRVEVANTSISEAMELIQFIVGAAQQKGRDVSILVVNGGTNGGTYMIRPSRNITPASA